MDFKFLHAADLHLDSPLRGLSVYEGVPADVVRTATRGALDNLVEHAISEEVAFVILAGDLYDGTWEAFATGLYFCKAMGRLERAGIAVYLLYGNHDAESHLTSQLPLPANVKVFSKKAAQTYEHPATGAVLHGHSYAARDPGGDLVPGYPAPKAGAFNIGVLHTALTGDRGHDPYAPCTPEQLTAKGYDYWALGHVHGFEVVRRDPAIVFPGNLQGRHIRETGPKGAALISVSEGQVSGVEHVALDVVRWVLAEVDIGTAVESDEVFEAVRATLKTALAQADGRPLMARVRLFGESPLHAQFAADRRALREGVRAVAMGISDQVWIEKVDLASRDLATVAAGSDEFEAILTELALDPKLEADLARDLADFLAKAPTELDAELAWLERARAGTLAPLLAEAATALRARLGMEAAP